MQSKKLSNVLDNWIDGQNSNDLYWFVIANFDYIKAREQRGLSLRKKKIDLFFLKKRLNSQVGFEQANKTEDEEYYHNYLNQSSNVLEVKIENLNIPNEHVIDIKTLVR